MNELYWQRTFFVRRSVRGSSPLTNPMFKAHPKRRQNLCGNKVGTL